MCLRATARLVAQSEFESNLVWPLAHMLFAQAHIALHFISIFTIHSLHYPIHLCVSYSTKV